MSCIWSILEKSKRQFHYSSNVIENESFTKWQVLSSIAKIFEPLSLIVAVIVPAENIVQKMWLVKHD